MLTLSEREVVSEAKLAGRHRPRRGGPHHRCRKPGTDVAPWLSTPALLGMSVLCSWV
jgi:hypothetical protein